MDGFASHDQNVAQENKYVQKVVGNDLELVNCLVCELSFGIVFNLTQKVSKYLKLKACTFATFKQISCALIPEP